MKKKITESQLRSIIAESVKIVLKEAYNPQDDIDAKEFMSWAMNSRSDVMQNIYEYYRASREGNESNASWYMDRILFAYANEKGCEESQLNTNAIEKAINEWGYYNYQEYDEGEDEGEDELEEGIVQKGVQGVKSFFGKGDSISPYNPITKSPKIVYKPMKRMNAGVKNFSMKGQYDDLETLIQQLSQIIDEKNIPTNITLAQFIGGKYNQGKFGTLTGRKFNRKSQGSKAQRQIYRNND